MRVFSIVALSLLGAAVGQRLVEISDKISFENGDGVQPDSFDLGPFQYTTHVSDSQRSQPHPI